MSRDELADLVRDVRAAQRRAFAARTAEAMLTAAELEARLDRVLRDLADPPAPGLFDRPTLLAPEHPDKP